MVKEEITRYHQECTACEREFLSEQLMRVCFVCAGIYEDPDDVNNDG